MTRSTRNRGGWRVLSYPRGQKGKTYICTREKRISVLEGVDRMDAGPRDRRDQRVHHLYSLATGSKDKNIRREARFFLGALERAGCDDAARVMDSLRKRAKEKDIDPPT
jgi:hypothetical protein